jgi:hypothetical protein
MGAVRAAFILHKDLCRYRPQNRGPKHLHWVRIGRCPVQKVSGPEGTCAAPVNLDSAYTDAVWSDGFFATLRTIFLMFNMNQETPLLFTESALGGLNEAARWADKSETGRRWSDRQAAEAPEPMSYVETLGFPRGTPPLLLAQVLQDIRGISAGRRVERLLSPGVLSPLFSQSAAAASYALSILSIVESPDFDAILSRLRCD